MELNETIDIHTSTFNSTTTPPPLKSSTDNQCHNSNKNTDLNHLDDTISPFGANKTLLNLNKSEIYVDDHGDEKNVNDDDEEGYYAEDFESDDDDELKQIDVKNENA